MAWFRNIYRCGDCNTRWEDEWSCPCDDECPTCGSSDWSPYESEDLTFVVEPNAGDGGLAVYESPPAADDRPRYRIIVVVPNKRAADRFISWRMAAYRVATR